MDATITNEQTGKSITVSLNTDTGLAAIGEMRYSPKEYEARAAAAEIGGEIKRAKMLRLFAKRMRELGLAGTL